MIVKPLHTWWVYEKALLLALGDIKLFVDNWVQLSLESYEVSPIAIGLQYNLITFMT
jgi:hypothetical protein